MCVRLERKRGHLNLLERKRDIAHCMVDRDRERVREIGWLEGRKKGVRRVRVV